MTNKLCRRCDSVKTIEEFGKDKYNPDGLTTYCKQCRKEISKQSYEKNINNIKEYQKNRTPKQKTNKALYYKDYQQRNKKPIQEYNHTRWINNKELLTEQHENYLQLHPEYTKQYWKEYYQKNKQKILIQKKEYLQQPIPKLIHYQRTRINILLGRISKAAHTLDMIGCSGVELKSYLESKFKEGMTWDNYGEWHVDHIRPCASFDLSDAEQQKKCFHYTNLQPLWKEDNLRKGNKII